VRAMEIAVRPEIQIAAATRGARGATNSCIDWYSA